MLSNMPVVTVEQFSKIIEDQYREGIKRPIFGLGKGGIGKTESIMNLAKNKLHIGYIDIRLLLYAETDLKGIPYPSADNKSTVWLQNNVLPTVERDGENGILVLDEITSVSKSIRTAAYQLLNERKLGQYELPEGWMVVCLGNGEEDGGDFEGMEANFTNRCSLFNVVPDIDTWRQWAFNNNINYLVLAYLNFRPQDLHTFDPDSESDLLFASPRSWKAVSDVLNKHPYNKDDLLTELRILGNIGTTVGHRFTAFCNYKNGLVNPEDIVNGVVLEFNPENSESVYITVQSVVNLVAEKTARDIKNKSALQVDTIIYWINAVKWMLSLTNLEYRIMAIKDLIASNRQAAVKLFMNQGFISKVPELSEFVQSNSGIFDRG